MNDLTASNIEMLLKAILYELQKLNEKNEDVVDITRSIYQLVEGR